MHKSAGIYSLKTLMREPWGQDEKPGHGAADDTYQQ